MRGTIPATRAEEVAIRPDSFRNSLREVDLAPFEAFIVDSFDSSWEAIAW
jgi:hypothetical protein